MDDVREWVVAEIARVRQTIAQLEAMLPANQGALQALEKVLEQIDRPAMDAVRAANEVVRVPEHEYEESA